MNRLGLVVGTMFLVMGLSNAYAQESPLVTEFNSYIDRIDTIFGTCEALVGAGASFHDRCVAFFEDLNTSLDGVIQRYDDDASKYAYPYNP